MAKEEKYIVQYKLSENKHWINFYEFDTANEAIAEVNRMRKRIAFDDKDKIRIVKWSRTRLLAILGIIISALVIAISILADLDPVEGEYFIPVISGMEILAFVIYLFLTSMTYNAYKKNKRNNTKRNK